MNVVAGRAIGPASEPKLRLSRLAVLLVICGVTLVLVLPRLRYRRTNLHSCFQSASGLRPGAEVRVSGIAVGVVRTITAGDRQCLVDVEMTVRTKTDAGIPADSVARLAGTAGSQAFVEIDTRGASAGPVRENGVMKSRE